ncbi:MAG: hypothetical protein IT205_03070 [Fimbriimonadaceae bacterium]|nr:hypothetical protein [Fimbriimonadaceae bacterium]
MINLGTVRPCSTIYIPFESFATSTGAPITITGLATSDVLIYKDGGTTQRASAAGITLLDTDGIDFDSITGIHGFSIDLSDNTTADFYAAGSRYFVVVSTVTVDSQTMSFIAATFDIGYPSATLNTTIATLASQTSFTLAAGPAEDDALNGRWAVIHDAASAVQSTWVQISAYTGSTKTVTLAAAGTFTVAAKDNFSLMDVQPLMPTTTGRTLDVSAGGEAGVDWANVGSPTTSLALTGTTIATTQKVDVETIKTNPVVNAGTVTFPTTATLASTTNVTAGTITTVSGNVNGSVGSVTGAVGSVTGNVGGNVTGSVGSVVGAVGSVTGNVGGNVTGSVGSVVGAVGSVTGNVGGNVVGSVASVTAKVTPIDVDGITFANMMKYIGATTQGRCVVTFISGSAYTFDYYDIAGTTIVWTATCTLGGRASITRS